MEGGRGGRVEGEGLPPNPTPQPLRHAAALVYADDMDFTRPSAFEPIGISCRICERTHCHQRSVPPLEKRLTTTPNHRDVLPYRLD